MSDTDLNDRRTPLRFAPDARPLDVIRAAKAAAVKHNWMLGPWVQFSREAYATLDAEASDESLVKFREVVAKWFRVEEDTKAVARNALAGVMPVRKWI